MRPESKRCISLVCGVWVVWRGVWDWMNVKVAGAIIIATSPQTRKQTVNRFQGNLLPLRKHFAYDTY